MNAGLDPHHVRLSGRARLPGAGLPVTTGLAAICAAALVLILAWELRITGVGWLPWIVLALGPAVAAGLCLARRDRAGPGPAAAFGSCTAVIGVTVPVGIWRSGAVITVIAVLAVVAGAAAMAAALALRSGQAARLARNVRSAAWWTAAVAVTVLSVPSPAYFPPGPIGTIFSGDTGSQDVIVAFGLVLVALPLVAAGLVPAATSAAIAAGWLPVAVAQLIAGPIIQTAPASLDGWYYATWVPWLAVAALVASAAGLLKPHSVS